MPADRYDKVGKLFAGDAHRYDAARRQLIPCFDAFYGTAALLARKALEEQATAAPRMIDLGAGSGLLTRLVLDEAADLAAVVLVDISEAMLAEARKRFAGEPRVSMRIGDYTSALDVPSGSVELVVSALSIHHLSDADKRSLFRRIFGWLKPGGMFINADQVLGPTPALEQRYREQWLQDVRRAGLADADLERALRRMTADKMATLDAQLQWLADAGFEACDCAFKHWSFAVMHARRPHD